MAETISLIPAGFEGEKAHENIKRCNAAVAELDRANADYANKLEEIICFVGRDLFVNYMLQKLDADEAVAFMGEIDEINNRRDKAREEFLRSMAGAPPAPEKR